MAVVRSQQAFRDAWSPPPPLSVIGTDDFPRTTSPLSRLSSETLVCQSASGIDPPSASNTDPPWIGDISSRLPPRALQRPSVVAAGGSVFGASYPRKWVIIARQLTGALRDRRRPPAAAEPLQRPRALGATSRGGRCGILVIRRTCAPARGDATHPKLRPRPHTESVCRWVHFPPPSSRSVASVTCCRSRGIIRETCASASAASYRSNRTPEESGIVNPLILDTDHPTRRNMRVRGITC